VTALHEARLGAAGMSGVRMPPRRLRVVIYARVSQDSHQGRSVGQQLKIGRERAEEFGWEIVGEFSDNDTSVSEYAGAGMDREDWPKVEAMIRAGGVDIVWLWELSRSTRDRLVWAHLVKACQANNVVIGLNKKLWDVNDPDDMAYLDNLMIRSIHESGTTRKRVLRDIDAHAEEGKPHGYAHYAYTREYDPDTGELVQQVIHPQRAALIVEIADRLLEDKHTPTSIAADLNRRRIRTPRGQLLGETRELKNGRQVRSKGWTHKTVRQLMSSPTLKGKRGYHGRVIEQGGWPAVLAPPRWQAVQEALTPKENNNGRLPREESAMEMLSGIVVCDECGAVVYAVPIKRENVRLYRCAGLGQGAPVHGSRRVKILDEAFESFLFARLEHPDVRTALVPRENRDVLTAAEKQVGELEQELAELYEAVEQGRVSWQMGERAEKPLLKRLEAARVAARPVMVDPLLVELTAGPAVRVWRGWTMAQRRAAVRLLVKEVRMLAVGPVGRRKLPPEQHVKVEWVGVFAE